MNCKSDLIYDHLFIVHHQLFGKMNYLYPIVGYRIQPLRSGKINFRIFGSLPIWDLASTPWAPIKKEVQ